MITWIEHVFVLAFAVGWPVRAYLEYPRFRRRVRAGEPGARLAAYAESMIVQWLFAAGAVALGIRLSWDWSTLGLTLPAGGRGLVGLALALALSAFLLAQSVLVASRRATHAEVRRAIEPAAELLPADRNDLKGFVALSLTAGVCEELLFRGVLAAYFAHALGYWGGHAAALAVFGAAHSYLGPHAALKALGAGLVVAALYVGTGSLAPSMLVHAVMDAASGYMAYAVRAEPARSATS
jgi:membrane protease YdiL (CAAX protease family)